MTENEAIKYIQRDIYFINKMIEHDKRFDPKADISRYLESKTVYEMAITALKEIGKYNDCKLCLVPADVMSKQCCELDEYKGIGTVEECWEAMEKKKPKKPVWKNGSSIICKDYADGHGEVEENKWADWLCPNCGWFVGEQYIPRRHNQQKSNYCSRCGQAIQWENSEGMENGK